MKRQYSSATVQWVRPPMRGVKGRPAVLCGMQQGCIAPSSVCDRSPATVPHPCQVFFDSTESLNSSMGHAKWLIKRPGETETIYMDQETKGKKKKRKEKGKEKVRKEEIAAAESRSRPFAFFGLVSCPCPPWPLALRKQVKASVTRSVFLGSQPSQLSR